MGIETRTEDDGEKLHTIKEVKISAIYYGSVFDHLHAGTGRKFFDALETIIGPEILSKKSAIIHNVYSKTYDKKDLVKLEEVVLNEAQLKKLYDKFPRFTYSIIEKGEVVEKYADCEFRLHRHQDMPKGQQRIRGSSAQ